MQLVPQVRLDSKAPLAHKDLRETLVQPVRWARRAPPAPLVRRDLPAPLGQPGRKALRELLARREGFLAGRNFKTAVHSSCLLESDA